MKALCKYLLNSCNIIWGFSGFPGESVSKESTFNAEYQGLIPGLRRSPGEGNGASQVALVVKNPLPVQEAQVRSLGQKDPPTPGIRIAGRNSNNLRYADDTTLMAESEEEPKSLLTKVKEESEKVGLKLNIQEIKIMESGPITSREMHGETVETVTDLIFRGSKITADGDCSHEIKGCLLLGRKVMTNLDSIFKSRDITLPTKVHLVKPMVFQWSCMDVRVGL